MGKARLDALVEGAAPRDQARILEQRSGLGSTWMKVTPSPSLHTTISAADYVLGLRWWLGAHVVTVGLEDRPKCPGCEAEVDEVGDHLLCCPRNNFANRNNAVQEALAGIFQTAGQPFQKEVPPGGRRRGPPPGGPLD